MPGFRNKFAPFLDWWVWKMKSWGVGMRARSVCTLNSIMDRKIFEPNVWAIFLLFTRDLLFCRRCSSRVVIFSSQCSYSVMYYMTFTYIFMSLPSVAIVNSSGANRTTNFEFKRQQKTRRCVRFSFFFIVGRKEDAVAALGGSVALIVVDVILTLWTRQRNWFFFRIQCFYTRQTRMRPWSSIWNQGVWRIVLTSCENASEIPELRGKIQSF